MIKFRLHRNKEKLSDDELLLCLREKEDVECFYILYERYIPLIYGLCLKYLQQPADAQDATVDIYESLSGKITGYEIKNFKNWLYSVAKHHCFQKLRENKKEILVNFDSQIMESDETLNLFSEDKDDEKEAVLNKCMDKLPEPQKISIQQFFYENKSYAEIVDLTKYNLKSVKSYIQNGKRNLKICIEKSLSEI